MKRLITTAVLLVAVAGTMRGEESALLKLTQTIPLPHVKGGFDLMAVDVAGRRLFVSAEDNNTVEVIDLAAGKWLRSVSGFKEPKWVVYRPESRRLYVANGGDGKVRVLDSRSFELVKEFEFKGKADNLRYDAKTKQLFVAFGKGFGTLGVVDTVKDAIVGEIKLADFPEQFEMETGRILVNVPAANHIAVIDRKRGAVVDTWPVREAKENVPMSFDRNHRRLFVGCKTGKFVVLDADSGKSVASLDIAAGCDGIYYDAKRKRLYISCGAGSLDVIQQLDADHYALAGRIPTAPGADTSLFVPELDRLYLAVPQSEQQKPEIRFYQMPRGLMTTEKVHVITYRAGQPKP